MSRVGRVRRRGSRPRGTGRIGRLLTVLHDDLWTWRADPLPPSVWLRWFPHGVVCLAALGVLLGDAAQLSDNGGVEPGLGFVIALSQAGAMVGALWRPVASWWLSLAAMLVGAFAVRAEMIVDGAKFTWPWPAAGIIGHMFVLLLLSLRVRTRVSMEALGLTALATYLVQGVVGAPNYQPTGQLAVILFAVVVVLGTALRGRREARAELVQQTSLTAEERARRTVLEERSRIARELHDVRVLVLTTFDLDEYVYEALVAGASGFLLKDASADQLAEAVRVVAAGDALLAPGVTRRLITEFSRMRDRPRTPLKERVGDLTERETEVLALIAQGLSNAEIAGRLVVAEQTVKTHVGRILVKLGLRDRTQAAVYAYECGLVRPSGY
ncbi:LuxR C-terminal-related transcriptional regulator [Streptomyces rochei]